MIIERRQYRRFTSHSISLDYFFMLFIGIKVIFVMYMTNWLQISLAILILGFIAYCLYFPKKERQSITQNIHVIYYINLEQRKDRKVQFLKNFSEKDYSRIERINAFKIEEEGAIGCLMSHIYTLNKALNDKNSQTTHVLVCEDDFQIPNMEYLNKMVDFALENLPQWDVIMLGHNTFDKEETEYVHNFGEKIIRVRGSQTTSGYLIQRDYIPKLLSVYVSVLEEYRNTGVWINEKHCVDRCWLPLQKEDYWFTFVPSVGGQAPSFSDIQKGFVDPKGKF